MENELQPSVFENTFFQVTSITILALLHLTWQGGH
jgi:hypothetical protein